MTDPLVEHTGYSEACDLGWQERDDIFPWGHDAEKVKEYYDNVKIERENQRKQEQLKP